MEFRCNGIGAAVAVSLGLLLIPWHGAFAAAVALASSAGVVLVLAMNAARQVGISVPPISRALPALSALAVAWLAARSLSGFGSWVAAAGATGVYLLLLILSEFRGLLRWRLRAVRPDPTSPLAGEPGLDFEPPISA
jgi:hypothetical protein